MQLVATALYSELLNPKNYHQNSYIAILSSIKIINSFFGSKVRDYVAVNNLLIELHNSSLHFHIHTVHTFSRMSQPHPGLDVGQCDGHEHDTSRDSKSSVWLVLVLLLFHIVMKETLLI